jgi:hypothetical protein
LLLFDAEGENYYPYGIAIDSSANLIYVANRNDDTVSVTLSVPVANTSSLLASQANTGEELCRARTPCFCTDRTARAIKSSLHTYDLPSRKHDHCGIIDIIHIIHEHVAVGSVITMNNDGNNNNNL